MQGFEIDGRGPSHVVTRGLIAKFFNPETAILSDDTPFWVKDVILYYADAFLNDKVTIDQAIDWVPDHRTGNNFSGVEAFLDGVVVGVKGMGIYANGHGFRQRRHLSSYEVRDMISDYDKGMPVSIIRQKYNLYSTNTVLGTHKYFQTHPLPALPD
ncbi:hypothetical protein H8D36_02585 [archaeon]|nr:hypothetical protein [archaeon]MBL7057555.1 hypothetical protein [Candidatus Woesearchaeota archaeon]